MKEKNKKLDIALIILSILAIIFTLLILSNRTFALNAGEKTTLNNWSSEKKTIGDLARYVAYSPNEFMKLSPSKLFGLDYSGWYDQVARYEPLLNYKGKYDTYELYYQNGEYHLYTVATWYTSAMCIYYSAADPNTDTYGNIVNVIDINTNPAAPTMKVYYEKNGSLQSAYNKNLTESENQTMTAFSYLLNQATLYERKHNSSTDTWELGGTFTKDLNSDNNISGMSKMYDTQFWEGRPISQIKAAITQVLLGGQNIKKVDKNKTVLKIFSESTVNGQKIIDMDYSGLTNSYANARVEFESDNMGSYLTNAISAGENAKQAKCEFKETDNNGNSIVPEIKIVDNNAYIGPFAVIYSGGTPKISIEGVNISGWARLNTNGQFSSTNSTSTAIPKSEANNTQLFYLVASATSVGSKTKLKININLEYSYYTARVALTAFRNISQQNIMLYAAKKHTGSISDSLEMEASKEIIIQKQDASGNNLNIAGIKFEVYNSSNKIVGTLTTDATGKTNALKVEDNQEYTIKETSNSIYGYKGAVITEAKITSGKGTVSVSNGQVKASVGQDSMVIAIKNKPVLGNIIIDKKDGDNKSLAGVEFVIYKAETSNTGYLKIDGITSPYETPSGGLDITKYEVTYVSSKNDATKFKTNSSGQIVINNLEVYSAPGAKYNYYITEVSNNNYGYQGMNVSAKIDGGNALNVEADGDIQFNLSESTTNVKIIITNNPQLGKLEIVKVNDKGTKIPNVEFIVERESNQYIQIRNASGKVEKITGKAIINKNNQASGNEYKVEYVSKQSDATIFVTDANGKIVIENLEIENAQKSYKYRAKEIANNNYGYIDDNYVSEYVTLQSGKVITLNIPNELELGELQIEKYNKDNKNVKLENVEFVIERNANNSKGYVALYDKSGKLVKNITGKATISENNVATSTTYSAKYVSNQNDATIFKTDANGKIEIENLEIYLDKDVAYKYKAIELSNNNYGYVDENYESEYVTLNKQKTITINVPNEQYIGNITVIKEDSLYGNIKLDNVGFIIDISLNGGNKAYLALYNQKGFVKEVKGIVTINEKNVASASQYRVEYVTDKSKATTFITGDNGVLTINNLEVYKRGDASKAQYSYTLTETSNLNYGYIVNSQKIENVKIVDEKTTETKLGNKQELVKISGYVWIENPQGKSNGYDNVYTNNGENSDKILKDLYTGSEGNLSWNENAEIPVKIQLQDKNGNIIKDKPDSFATDGKYTFVDLDADELSKYQVVFVYDGFYYTTVVPNQGNDVTINSKVKEVQSERNTLSNKFSEVGENGSLGGQNGAVTYKKQDNKAKVEKINVDTSISANTKETGIDFATELDKLKKSPNTEPVEGIQNINMGLVIREQPDLSLFNDIEKVIINVNGYEYSYVYATRNLYTEKQEDQLGVKFENEAYLTQRYTRTIYASDIQAAKEGSTELKVSIIYKTTIVNESRTLTIAPKQIASYFDSRYTIEKDETGKDMIYSTSGTQVNVESLGAVNDKYNVAKIGYSGQLKAGTQDEIYIRFNVSKEAIIKLLDSESTYYNAVEINKYSSYYTSETGKIDGKAYISDSSTAGSIYAGIDEDSAPGNIELKLVDHPSGGTQILDTSKYEDDTDAAPALILEAGEERIISGTVWEDTDENTADNERLGNGIYDSDEKPIANVKLELVEIVTDNNGNTTLQSAKYSNGAEATATTNNEGKYSFGGGRDENGKYIGILPGTYLIKYKYNNESYIVGGNNINAMDYKSTIITSGVIENAINSAENITAPNGTTYPGDKWYLIDEGNRYSDAIDDMDIRNSLSNSEVKYELYKNGLTTTMEAKTPIMEIGIEYTVDSEAKVEEDGKGTLVTLINNLDKVDFGIIHRPKVEYDVEKRITSLEIVGQTGANIVPKGNPYTDSMTYIRALEGQVSAEIDSNLLQSATLKIEYTIKVSNISEIDYTEQEYYYYGRNGHTKAVIKIKKVVDYLDNSLGLDPEKVEENKLYGWLKGDGTENIYTYTQLTNEGLISEDVANELKKGESKIFITEEFNDVVIGGNKEVKLYASKLIGASDEINAYNDVEIIELTGGRTITSSIPGNYIPTHDGAQYGGTHENDDDRARLVIVPPTGATVNYTNYIIAIGATLAILVTGIIVIKKIMKKQ